ncbi:8710_t:CDS:2 [Ambispora gerdemannii]|uniref:8710_t:CDS:1 n=1 Tax=Ambispora gerdemannii TaxID=144530 RepID=A0A9N8W6D2_9GLOM|nr:8710_t:CDS:2 [Ambispora gerdemannii]
MSEHQKQQQLFPDYYSFSFLQNDHESISPSSIDPYPYYDDNNNKRNAVNHHNEVVLHFTTFNENTKNINDNEQLVFYSASCSSNSTNESILIHTPLSSSIIASNNYSAVTNNNPIVNISSIPDFSKTRLIPVIESKDDSYINYQSLQKRPTTTKTQHLRALHEKEDSISVMTDIDDDYDENRSISDTPPMKSEDNNIVNKKFNDDWQLRFVDSPEDGVIERFNTARRNTVSISKGISATRVEERLPYVMLNIENYNWRDCVDVGLE